MPSSVSEGGTAAPSRIPKRPLVLAAILLSMFMGAMEATVVATAMPTVVADLHGLELYGWVGSVYLLASTVTIPLWGKLADLWGRKPVLLFGLFAFLLGSTTSGFASTMSQLIAFRAVQGVGAGSLQPIALTIAGDIYTLEERSRIQGVFGAVWGLSAMAGPLIGGLIVRALSWRWVFFINLPFGCLAALFLVAFFAEKRPQRAAPISLDVAGATVLALAVVALLAGVSGRASWVTLPGAAVLLAAFLRIEQSAREPILPLSMFRIRTLSVASIAGTLMGAVMMATLLYLPLFAQAARDATPTGAGATVAPMLLGWPIASTLSGRILPRVGGRFLVRVGLGVLATATSVLWYAVGHGASLRELQVIMFVFGSGMGLANTALIIAVQGSVEWKQRGVATATTMFFRSIGGAIAMGALGVVLARAVAHDLPPAILTDLLGPEHGRSLSPERLAGVASVIERGMRPIFATVAALGLAAGIAGWVFPPVLGPGDEPIEPQGA